MLRMNATAAIIDPATPVILQPNLFTNAPAIGPTSTIIDIETTEQSKIRKIMYIEIHISSLMTAITIVSL